MKRKPKIDAGASTILPCWGCGKMYPTYAKSLMDLDKVLYHLPDGRMLCRPCIKEEKVQ